MAPRMFSLKSSPNDGSFAKREQVWGESGTDQSQDFGQNFRQLVSTAGPGAALSHLISSQAMNLGSPASARSSGVFLGLQDMLRQQAGMGLPALSSLVPRIQGGGGGATMGTMRPGIDYQGMASQQMARKQQMDMMRDNEIMRDLQIRSMMQSEGGEMDRQFRAADSYNRLLGLLPRLLGLGGF